MKVTTTDALATACPVCGSDPGIPCIDPDGSIPHDVHRRRYEVAAEIEPCADCGHPVRWVEERGTYVHTEPGQRCFLHGAPEDGDPEPCCEETPDLEVEIRYTFEDDAEAVAILEGLIDRIRRDGLRADQGGWVVRDVNGNTVGDLTVAEVEA